MANEIKLIYGTARVLEDAGGAIASGAFAQAADASVSETDSLDWPDADFVLSCAFSTAPAAGRAIAIYAQPLDVDGTEGTPAPSSNVRHHYIGAFAPNNVTTLQTLWLRAYDLPRRYACWLENSAGQPIAAGWSLKIIPRTTGTV